MRLRKSRGLDHTLNGHPSPASGPFLNGLRRIVRPGQGAWPFGMESGRF